ncbi:discoidin domain-containing protein [Brenneria uluponensis]|uniref:discoidin domain-containing protein n=1 Tax=Brenneria uluponensis TaxID=3057057 RepID=UPI0028E53216|nr:discoidin domain-containing protein [Brenneria ulupoensis]
MIKYILPSILALTVTSIGHTTPIAAVHASAYDETNGHKPDNAIDGNVGTRWAAQGKETWITLELAKNEKVTNVALVPFRETERSLKFSLYLSKDNKKWEKVGQDLMTNKADKAGEKFSFPATTARYIKLVTNGTDVNNWSAINEIMINSDKDLPSTTVK